MKSVLKWVGIILAGLLGIILIGGVSLHFAGRSRLNHAPEVATRPVVVHNDAAQLARGEHLVNVVSSCRLCHGQNLEGDVLIDGEIGLYVIAPNLTSGAGGIASGYADADWERAIRHGIGGDGRVLVIMPANFYAHMSDEDLGAVIAYLKTVPPADLKIAGERQIGFPGSILGGFLGFDEFTRINGIDHASVGGQAVVEGSTAAYGRYLTSIAMCGECHAPNLAGITGDDGPPPGPNLTPGGDLGSWTEADFIQALRTGETPDGRQLDGEMMPWPQFSQMSDTELQALWAYLSSLPALPANP